MALHGMLRSSYWALLHLQVVPRLSLVRTDNTDSLGSMAREQSALESASNTCDCLGRRMLELRVQFQCCLAAWNREVFARVQQPSDWSVQV